MYWKKEKKKNSLREYVRGPGGVTIPRDRKSWRRGYMTCGMISRNAIL